MTWLNFRAVDAMRMPCMACATRKKIQIAPGSKIDYKKITGSSTIMEAYSWYVMRIYGRVKSIRHQLETKILSGSYSSTAPKRARRILHEVILTVLSRHF